MLWMLVIVTFLLAQTPVMGYLSHLSFTYILYIVPGSNMLKEFGNLPETSRLLGLRQQGTGMT